MKIAVQETLLAGDDTLARFQLAKSLGIEGIEVAAAGLTERLDALVEAMQATHVRVVAVNMGQHAGYLAPEQPERLQALLRVQQALADASDLMAENVIAIPHVGALTFTPDEADEIYVWFLRTVNDLAMAMDVTLCIQPVAPTIAPFMNSQAHAIKFCDTINRHPYVRLAPHTTQLATCEAHPAGALAACSELLRYVQLADSNGRLPGQGWLDWTAIAATLQSANYDGWLTLAGDTPVEAAELQTSIAYLQARGLAAG